jgi:hypothetical protein
VAAPHTIPLDVSVTVCRDCGAESVSRKDLEPSKAAGHSFASVHSEISARKNDPVALQRVALLQKLRSLAARAHTRVNSGAIVAMLLAAAVAAAGAIAPTAGAVAACSNVGFKKAVVAAEEYSKKAGASPTTSSGLATAAAEELAAWRTLRGGPVPCSSAFRVSRTHQLRAHVDAWRGIRAYGAGNVAAADSWFKKATHQMDLSYAAVAQGEKA